MKNRNSMFFMITIETAGLFLLGSLGSKFSEFFNLSPSVIIAISTMCILFISVLSVRRLELNEQIQPPDRTLQRHTYQLVPRTMLGALPFGMCIGLLMMIPSVAMFPGKLEIITRFPISISIPTELLKDPSVLVQPMLTLVVQKYEIFASFALLGIALLSAIFLGSHRAAAITAGWAIGASVATSILRPQENLIWYTFAGNALFAFVLGWMLIRLRAQLLRVRDALQTPRD